MQAIYFWKSFTISELGNKMFKWFVVLKISLRIYMDSYPDIFRKSSSSGEFVFWKAVK